MVKVSFVGDIMCELYTFRKMAARKEFNFESFFEEMGEKFGQSDYVIGNLETVFAGDKSAYTRDLYSFNTPDNLASAMATAGVNFVSTANNHCLDRGVAGLKRTLDVLDSAGVRHTGTYHNRKEYDDVSVVEVQGKKLQLSRVPEVQTILQMVLNWRGRKDIVWIFFMLRICSFIATLSLKIYSEKA